MPTLPINPNNIVWQDGPLPDPNALPGYVRVLIWFINDLPADYQRRFPFEPRMEDNGKFNRIATAILGGSGDFWLEVGMGALPDRNSKVKWWAWIVPPDKKDVL